MNILMVLSIASLFYISILGIIFFSKQKVKNNETKIYKILIITLIIEILLELSMRFLANYMDSLYFLNEIVAKVFVYISMLWFSIITVYNTSISFGNSKKIYDTIKKVIMISNVIIFVISLILPIEFYFAPGNDYYSYTYGLCVNFAYITFFLLMIFNVILLGINQFKNITKKHIPVILSIILLIICGVIQNSNPEFILNLFVQSLVTFIMFHTIENPDMKMIEQLDFAKQRAEQANHAKTEFLSNMSHEIRTPLNAIVGFSQALQNEDIPGSAKDEINDIIMASNSLLEIVNGILDISKIEAGKLEIINTEYSFKKIFDELIVLTKSRLGETGIDFRYSMDPTIPLVLYGDYGRIKQVILNILTNAVKYTKEGYIEFKVDSVVSNDICRLIISVEDSGIGIKKENVNKLFSNFERLGVEKEITIEGTGLGLAITKKLVELMHGSIVVQTVYGKGSKFTIAMDQSIVKAVNPALFEENSGSKLDIVDCTGKKILLVDDNKINLKVAARLLNDYHVTVDTCLSGKECLDKFATGNTYDLVFMDDMMPKMSGVETFNKLKETGTYNIPTIALTANAISGMKEKYLSDGFDDYLAKPIEKEELNRIIIKFLKQK